MVLQDVLGPKMADIDFPTVLVYWLVVVAVVLPIVVQDCLVAIVLPTVVVVEHLVAVDRPMNVCSWVDVFPMDSPTVEVVDLGQE